MILGDKVNMGLHYLRLIRFLGREKITGLYDAALVFLRVNDNSIRFKKEGTRKRLVFAGQVLNHRIIKIMKWLKSTDGYEIVVVCHASSIKTDLLPEYYDRLVLFRNKLHLERIVKGADTYDLLVAFASKPSYAEIAIKYSRIPSVFDVYDCMVIYHGKTSHLKWLRKELISEEYCFKNTSAVLARSPENRLAMNMYGIRGKKSIYFADYCDNEYFVNNPLKLERMNAEIRIVYAGGIHGKHLKNKLAQGLTDFYTFSENLETQRIHFHLYPSPYLSKENYYDYVEASKTMQYLHVHDSIPQSGLTKELSAYHFGVLPHFRTNESKITDAKLKTATSLKFYSYLEAGIPILVSSEMDYMAWLVRRYAIGIVFDKSDFPKMREKILEYDYDTLKTNVLEAREKLSMKNNMHRLISFIDQCICI